MSPAARAGVALALLLATCVCCAGGFFVMVGAGAAISSRVADLAPACSGSPVSGAAAYVPGPGVHLTTPFVRNGASWDYRSPMMPSAWRASDTASAELVLCLEPEQESILETCPYTTGLIVNRIQFSQTARLVVARTGQVLDTRAVVGDMPSPCQEWASGSGTTRYEGGHANDVAVERTYRGTIGP